MIQCIVLFLGHHEETMRGFVAEEYFIGISLPCGHTTCLAGRAQHHRAIGGARHGHACEIRTLPHAAGGGATGEVLGAVAYANRTWITRCLRCALDGSCCSSGRDGTASGGANACTKTTTMQSRASCSQHIHQLALTLLCRVQWRNRGSIATRGAICCGFLGDHICWKKNKRIDCQLCVCSVEVKALCVLKRDAKKKRGVYLMPKIVTRIWKSKWENKQCVSKAISKHAAD